MNRNIKEIRFVHAFVLHTNAEDAERVKEFILEKTGARLIFEKHSGGHLIIKEESECHG